MELDLQDGRWLETKLHFGEKSFVVHDSLEEVFISVSSSPSYRFDLSCQFPFHSCCCNIIRWKRKIDAFVWTHEITKPGLLHGLSSNWLLPQSCLEVESWKSQIWNAPHDERNKTHEIALQVCYRIDSRSNNNSQLFFTFDSIPVSCLVRLHIKWFWNSCFLFGAFIFFPFSSLNKNLSSNLCFGLKRVLLSRCQMSIREITNSWLLACRFLCDRQRNNFSLIRLVLQTVFSWSQRWWSDRSTVHW
jgi:hypothetical protein